MYLRRIPWIAILLILVLRIAIGWQLFYEGLWKTKTLSSPKPWTSEGYLRNSQGPMRATFRNMTGDPSDLDWLNVDKMTAKWSKWKSRFTRHYELTDRQKSRLNSLVEGPSAFYSDKDAIQSLPEGVDLSGIKLSQSLGFGKDVEAITFDKENGRLKVHGKAHLDGKEFTKIFKMLPPTLADQEKKILAERKKQFEAGKITEEELEAEIKLDPEPKEITTFRTQLDKVYARSSRLSYLEKLRAELAGSPDLTGSKENNTLGELKKYKEMIADYETLVANAKQDYQHEHLKKTWKDLQEQRVSLIGPIKALEDSMRDDAEALLSVDQMQRSGKLAEPWTGLQIADTLTILGLTLCGFCLIIGLFTRFSATMAAIMLFSFYLAMPPLPGLPEAPGPEHSMIVNKNLIEVFALAAIAALPTGYWCGFDGLVAIFWRKLTGKDTKEE